MIVWQLGLQQLSVLIATNYKCCEFESHSWQDVLDTTLCDKVCQWLSPVTLVSSTNKTDRCNIIEKLLKMVFSNITLTLIDCKSNIVILVFYKG